MESLSNYSIASFALYAKKSILKIVSIVPDDNVHKNIDEK